MNVISFFDLVAVAALVYALGVLLLSGGPRDRHLRGALLLLVMVYMADSAPNFLEWLGYQDVVEPFEAYIEILLPIGFLPLFAMAVYRENQAGVAARGRVLDALHSITENLPTSQDPGEVWTETLGRTIRVMGFDGGFVDLPEEKGSLDIRVKWEGFDDFARQIEDLEVRKTVLGQVLDRRSPMVFERTTDSGDYFIQALRIGQAASAALFPVFSQERALGVMGIVSRSTHVFTREEVDLFSVLGRHLGDLILNRVLLREARENHLNLERAIVSRGNFLQAVTDNLRDPLSRLRDMVGRLGAPEAPWPNGENGELFRLLSEDAGQLEKLLRDVTELTRLEKEEGAPRFAPVDLRSEIVKAAEAHSSAARKKGVSLATRLQDSYAPLEADREMLRSALHHLLSNAIKYTPSGGSVTLSAQEDQESSRVRVEDNGIGIPQEDVPHIFETFYRTGPARGRQKTGTGLGLAIVRMIARRHGGDVTFTSEVNKGTAFTLTLPRLQIK